MGKQGFVADAVRRVQERLAIGPPRPVAPGSPTPRIAIIGSGFGGIGMGIQLKRAGIESFTIYEKADRIGGTWRDNTYPGARVRRAVAPLLVLVRRQRRLDAASSPGSPRSSPTSTAAWTGSASATTSGSAPSWPRPRCDEDDGTWHLLFIDGSTVEADVLVAATGQLNRPHVPDIDGLDGFGGHQFHSARWDHDHDLTDRDVAVVGIGASADPVRPGDRQAGPIG